MSTMMFINLPVADLERSKAFYTALGYDINPLFTDENAACIVIDDSKFFMLLTREYFQTFTSKTVIDAKSSVQTLIAVSRDSREAVDEIADAALAAGGAEAREPQDYGFMMQRAIEDPDGHILEFVWMDPKAAEEGPGAVD